MGYQNKSLNENFNFVVNTFVPVGTDKAAMTFGDIKPNSEFVNSSIQLLTSGGATAKVTVDGLGTVKATFSYWEEKDASDGAGWYLDADDDAEYNQNARIIQAGSGFLVNRAGTESDATITIPSAL